MNEAAEEKLMIEWIKATQKIQKIQNFRAAFFANERSIQQSFLDSSMALAADLRNNPKREKLFKDKTGFFKAVGGIEGMASQLAANSLKDAHDLLNTTSIIMFHSIFDNFLFELIHIIKIMAISDFRTRYQEKKIKFSEIDKGSDALIAKFIEDERLDRESLLKKVEILWLLCKPPEHFSPIDGYDYDRQRLEELDSIRHDVVHENIGEMKKEWAWDYVWANQTLLFFICLLNERYGLRMNPGLWKKNLIKDIKAKNNEAS